MSWPRETETRTYTIEAPNDLLDRLEKQLRRSSVETQ